MQVGSLVRITDFPSGRNMGIITDTDTDTDTELLWKIHLFDGEVIYVGTEYVEIVCE